MTTTVFLSIMAATLLHASWNAIIKIGGNKCGMLIVTGVIMTRI